MHFSAVWLEVTHWNAYRKVKFGISATRICLSQLGFGRCFFCSNEVMVRKSHHTSPSWLFWQRLNSLPYGAGLFRVSHIDSSVRGARTEAIQFAMCEHKKYDYGIRVNFTDAQILAYSRNSSSVMSGTATLILTNADKLAKCALLLAGTSIDSTTDANEMSSKFL